MNALQRAFSDATLHNAWRTYSSRLSPATAVGIDGLSPADFSKNKEKEISEIVTLIRGGRYVFRRLKPYAIPKSGGQTRLINVPTIRDRFVQRVLLDSLVSEYGRKWKIPNSFTSMGIDGEGAHSILHQVSKTISYTDYIIKADLSKYFDTIERSKLKSMIRKKVRQRSLHQLLFAVIDCETEARNTHEAALLTANGILEGRGIRQGMPLSPVLAYLYLADVDRQMTGRFFRYVDDLLFIGSTKCEAVKQFSLYKTQAEARGLKIHPLADKQDGKTHLIGPTESFEFLGLTVCREPGKNNFWVPSESKKRIRATIEQALEIDPTDKKKQKGWLYANTQRATNLVRNYRSAYSICEDWSTFELELKQLQLHMCRRIAKKLYNVSKGGDRELLLRIFGI